MIIEEIKNIKSAASDLRKFGVTIGMALAFFGLLFFWRGKEWHIYLFIGSAIFIFLGIALPIALRPIYKIWTAFAVIMGFVMTRLLLCALFYIIVTPICLFSRLLGRDFLDIRLDRTAKSYWMPRKETEFNRHNYERQF